MAKRTKTTSLGQGQPDFGAAIVAFQQAKRTAMNLVADEMVFDIKVSLNTPNPTGHVAESGRTYYDHGSPLGTPPWKRSSVLKDSIRAEVKDGRIDIKGAYYGEYLEPERPFIAPQVHDRQGFWAARFNTLVGEILRRNITQRRLSTPLGRSGS